MDRLKYQYINIAYNFYITDITLQLLYKIEIRDICHQNCIYFNYNDLHKNPIISQT